MQKIVTGHCVLSYCYQCNPWGRPITQHPEQLYFCPISQRTFMSSLVHCEFSQQLIESSLLTLPITSVSIFLNVSL